jgi:hypothetical protein
MSKLLDELRERLLRAGVAPRHVRRYVAELNDHLADLVAEEEHGGLGRSAAEAAALVRLGGVEELAGAMEERHELRSWSAKAPWAVFAVGALGSLATAYAVALLILWSGWRMFLPWSSTPFVRSEGWSVPYFALGRLIYFGAPVFVGWGLGVIAARQRVVAVWPVVGIVLACVAGAMAQVRVGAVGSVGLAIAPVSVTYLAGLMALAGLPYLVWRLHSLPAGLRATRG